MDRKTEREAELEKVFVCHSLASFPSLMVFLEMLIVMGLEEGLDLLCEEGEKLLGCFGNHQFTWDCDFGLREGEGGIAIEPYGTNAEIGAA